MITVYRVTRPKIHLFHETTQRTRLYRTSHENTIAILTTLREQLGTVPTQLCAAGSKIYHTGGFPPTNARKQERARRRVQTVHTITEAACAAGEQMFAFQQGTVSEDGGATTSDEKKVD